MAKQNEAKVKFSADTKEFTQGIKDADSELKELRSELALNTAQMKGAGESTELLQQRHSILQRELEASQKKVENLNNKLEAAERIYGENSQEAQRLRVQLNNARTAEQNLQNELDATNERLEESSKLFGLNAEQADKLTEGMDNVANAAGATAAAIGALAVASATNAAEQELTLDKLQAQLGLTEAQMKAYNEVAREVYNDAYGEGMEDVANAIAEIRYQLGEMSTSELKSVTKNALVLVDVFDMDVKESTRAVNAMMKQFGITAEEAYNLIVQGAQAGLNQNDDLLDTINEYSVQFKSAGNDAEEMFNMLANGTANGTWSVDKLGDAIKEMNIRFSDGTVKQALSDNRKTLDLTKKEIEQLQTEYSKGGESAQKALQSTMDHLSRVQNESKRYQIGVSIFGTMWEDLGEETVRALVNTEGQISKVNEAISKVDETAYDNVVTDIQMAQREFEKLGEEVLEKFAPEIREFTEWAVDNSDEVIDSLEAIGMTSGTVFAVNKIAKFTTSIKSLMTTTAALKGAFTTAAASSTTLGSALSSITVLGPIGVMAGAAGASIYTMAKNTREAAGADQKLTSEEHKLIDKINERKKAVDLAKESQAQSMQTYTAEFSQIDAYVQKLENIVSKKGKIKKGHEEEAEVIQTALSEALGIEIDLTDLNAKSYKNLRKEINKTIAAKKAEAMLNVHQEEYDDAYANKNDDYNNYSQSRSAYYSKLSDLGDLKSKLKVLESGSLDGYYTDGQLNDMHWDLLDSINVAKQELQKLQKNMEEAESIYLNDLAIIENYENLYAETVNGTAKSMRNAMEKLNADFITANTGTEQMLIQQAETLQQQYIQQINDFGNGVAGVTQATVDEVGRLAKAAQKELETFQSNASKTGELAMKEFGNGVIAGKDTASETISGIGMTMLDSLPSIDLPYDAGLNFIKGLENGMKAGLPSLEELSKQVAEKNMLNPLQKGLEINSPSKATERMAGYLLDGFYPGFKKKEKELYKQSGAIAERTKASMINGFDTIPVDVSSTISRSINVEASNAETNRLLLQILAKDSNLYIDSYQMNRRTAPTRDRVDSVRSALSDRGVAYE